MHSWMAPSVDSNSSNYARWDLGGGQAYALPGLNEFEFRTPFQDMTRQLVFVSPILFSV